MIENIKPREAAAIINSLIGGVVPKLGLQHIVVGRSQEVHAFIQALEDVKNGHSMMKFWIGDFGSGKSFILHLLNTVALKQKFVVASADFTPDNRLYANDGKARILYSAIMDNIAIQTKPEGGALSTILEKWIEQIIQKTAAAQNISLTEIRAPRYFDLIEQNIQNTINELSAVGSFDMSAVVMKYYKGYIEENHALRKNALRWLKGEYTTKTEARQDLGVRGIISDENYYDMLKNFCRLFTSIGYSGFMVNLDEAINLYKISNKTSREKNYEKILTFYNDCFQGSIGHFFLNIAGTKEFLEDERRGLFSYEALKSRLRANRFEAPGVRDFAQPVIRLLPLDNNLVFTLLKKLKAIFDFNYHTQIDITDDEIHMFMEELYNKPGAHDFLMPREVIRDFLNVLNVLRQNPGCDKKQLFQSIEIHDERPSFNLDDTIEEI